ncbi:MAG TPA: F0F1 ATP synthase subunit A [Candidatus Limnocylindrales bacterium]|nr:F0F1 ATP synthase subunit A [Candidatus Limnocylindrales bacterium]
MSSDDRAAAPAAHEPATPGPDAQPAPTSPAPTDQPDVPVEKRGPSKARIAIVLIAVVVVLDIVAAIFVPPYPKEHPGEPVQSISDLIIANLELPAPEIVIPAHHEPPPGLVFWDVSITNTIITTWLVIAVVLVIAVALRLSLKWLPRGFQNFAEWAWEGLESWAYGLGGDSARRHIPLFVAFFLFIVFSNWSGLIPLFGRVEFLRAPTSDVNVTIGLALVVFVYFQFQGFRTLGVGTYLSKFFPLGTFRREGFGAGMIGLFVGLIEFMLEFIKPITLSMRLFGNIYGGEVALGVITALTIVILPAGFLLLEGLLNFVQALIFSTLMLMYTIIAVEVHDDHEEHPAIPEGGITPPIPAGTSAH